ncbi:hypothetical protein KFL_002000165 [Klebsormidium nitens]|uniref:Uncharacterized protein n=1 Tax=Klebsormidium nitens TaxID=105231 RepID=A0A1Y1I6B2_KLENI|nr:hypothetical protein KFL_002000165 [Klebsormidium nitens]|eukprot:GAQ84681.1 hypothetical protein KFL_002000165 [Klebsormidium nitens]
MLGMESSQAPTVLRTNSGGEALDFNEAASLTPEQEARLQELSQSQDPDNFDEFGSLVENLGWTDPDRAFRTYVQWYRRQDYMNQRDLLEGEALRSSFMKALAACHHHNAGKHLRDRNIALTPRAVFYPPTSHPGFGTPSADEYGRKFPTDLILSRNQILKSNDCLSTEKDSP